MVLYQNWHDGPDSDESSKLGFCILCDDIIGVMLNNWYYYPSSSDKKLITTSLGNEWSETRMCFKGIKRK